MARKKSNNVGRDGSICSALYTLLTSDQQYEDIAGYLATVNQWSDDALVKQARQVEVRIAGGMPATESVNILLHSTAWDANPPLNGGGASGMLRNKALMQGRLWIRNPLP